MAQAYWRKHTGINSDPYSCHERTSSSIVRHDHALSSPRGCAAHTLRVTWPLCCDCAAVKSSRLFVYALCRHEPTAAAADEACAGCQHCEYNLIHCPIVVFAIIGAVCVCGRGSRSECNWCIWRSVSEKRLPSVEWCCSCYYYGGSAADTNTMPLFISQQDVKDNAEEAAKVAPQTLQLCKMVSVPRGVCLLQTLLGTS